MSKLNLFFVFTSFGSILLSYQLKAQTSFEYIGGYPCLGTQIMVNAQLVVTDPPIDPYVASWIVTSPSGNIITQANQDTIVVGFNELGCWSVLLEIDGIEVENDPCGVEVFADPVTDINPISLTGCIPFTPVVDNATTLGTGTNPSYLWDIGFCPLIFDTDINGQCIINVPGTYDIFMSVTDENGCIDQFQMQDAIIVSSSPPNASFTASSLYDCNSPVDIGFFSTSTTVNPELTYAWTVDGISVGVNTDTLNYTFMSPATYLVCLEVTDDLGCSDSYCRSVEIFDTPSPDFSVNPTTICAGMNVNFENLSSPLPIPTVQWDLNADGIVDATGNIVNYSYQSDGTFDAELFINYSNHCSDSITKTVTVEPPIEALFDIDTLYGCSLPFDVQLTDISTGFGTLSYEWFLIHQNGTQTPITPNAGLFTFTSWGTYKIGLILTNDIGCFDEFIFPQNIVLKKPRIEFNLNAASNCVGDLVNTNIYLAQSLQPLINWYYDIGCDGSIEEEILGSSNGNTSFTFAAPGTYDVCLTAESVNGCTDTWQSSITIAPEIFSSFSVSDNTPCGVDTVEFTVDNPSPGVTYEWLTGDGNSSGPQPSPSYNYSYCDTGYMDVTLFVSNLGCYTSSTLDSLIHVPVPIADFSVLTNCENYYTVQMENHSIMPDTAEVIWIIDGVQMYIGEWEPSHTFTSEGSYNITLIVSNDSTDCTDLKTRSVKINEPTFEVSISPTTGCPPVLVDIVPLDTECVVSWDVFLEDSDFLSAEIGLYQPWDMDWYINSSYGSSSDTTINWPLVPYSSLGQFDISMSLQDVNGCVIDTTYEDIISIDIDPDFAQFQTNVTQFCDSAIIEATPLIPDLLEWNWATNSGLSDTTENVTLTFYPPYNQSQGTIISLSASLPGGCFSTVSESILLPRQINACASISEMNPCKGEVVFLDASCTICDLPPCDYAWDLNDDGLFDDATLSAASISWNSNGDYPVSLLVTDSLGCEDTWSGIINVHSPEIELAYSDTVIACQAYVTIQSTTVGPGLSSSWSFSGFDDQGMITPYIESLPSGASQIFAFNEQAVGVYDIDVTVTNQYGCSSDSSLIDILGYAGALGNSICTMDSLDCAPMSIHCESFDPSDDQLDYIWNMGDNSAYTSTIIDHTYTSPGFFPISLTITDPDNLCLFNVFGDTITVTQLQFDFNGLNTVCPGDSTLIQVSGLDSLIWASPLSQIIDVNSNSWYLTPENTTDFIATGYFEGCFAQQTLQLDNFILPSFNSDPFGPFCINQGTIGLPQITPLGGVYEWNDTEVSELNSYSINTDVDTVNYQFVDLNGCVSDTIVEFAILDTTLIQTDLTNLCINSASLDLNNVVSNAPASFNFDFGNGSIENSVFDPSLITNYPGVETSYSYEYEYTNPEGCTSEAIGEIIVHPAPNVQFIAQEVCLGDTLNLTNLSSVASGSIESQEWSFWNGNSSTLLEPSKVVSGQSGTLPISLEVATDQQCRSTYTDSVVVFPLPDLISEPYLPVCKNSGAIPLPTVSPSGGQYYIGDSIISALNTYEMEFENQVDYFYEDINGCKNVASSIITILDTSNISLNLPDMCVNGSPLDLANISSHGAGIFTASYTGTSIDSISVFEPSLIEPFPLTTSIHDIGYSYMNNQGCQSIIHSDITIYPTPVANFNTTEVCENEEIVFEQLSTIGSGFIDDYLWSIEGYGQTESIVPVGLTYSNFGSYSAELTLISDQGCISSLIDSLFVHPYPIPNYMVTDVCQGEAVIVQNNSTIDQGEIISAVFDWGDGNQTDSTNSSQQHTYSNYGSQEILVTLHSDKSCSVSESLLVYVHPNPVPNMYIDDHCFGLVGEGSDQSIIVEGNIMGVEFQIPTENVTFLDSSFIHQFSSSGTFDIIHIVTSSEGCSNEQVETVTVHPLPLPAFTTSDNALCSGQWFELKDNSSIELPYTIDSVKWSVDENIAYGETTAWYFSAPGEFDLQMTVFSDEGCYAHLSQAETIIVNQKPESAFNVKPQNITIATPLAQIIDNSVHATRWEYFIDGMPVSLDQNFTYKFSEVGDYEIVQVVSSEELCLDTSMQITNVAPHLIAYVPNAVTFDGDGLNDFFFPVLYGDEILEYEFRIFDRWGQVVFESEDPNAKWNGNTNGNNYYGKNEVYSWQLIISGQHTPVRVLQGSVTALR